MAMKTFWDRVDHLREQMGYTQQGLSEKLSLKKRAIETWKQNGSYPSADICVALAALLSTTTEYLVTGVELPLQDDEYVKEKKVEPLQTPNGKVFIPKDNEEPTLLVPIAPQKISAGRGEDFLPSSEYVGYVRILERMARGIDPARLIAAIVKGDSMTGVQIFSGDVVIFARGYLDENGLYVVSLRGEVLVKRMEFDRIHNQVAIISENKNYRPITVDANDEGVQILGKVVGWVHCHPY